MPRILIIGGTGNIGTRISQVLIERGLDVTLLNRARSGQMPGARTIVCDRDDRAAFSAAIASGPDYDCVIDMICYEPEQGQQLIDCLSGRTNQLIFCSTVDTHMKPAPRYPVTEDTPRSQNPAFGYAHKKGTIETMLEQAAAGGAFKLTILRPAATYNDRSVPIGIVSEGLAVMRRLKEGRPVILPGDGTSLWTSTHRDDVGLAFANAVLNLAAYQASYILAGDEALSWEGYYDALRLALGGPPPKFVRIPSDLIASADPDTRACAWCDLNFRFSNIFDATAARRDLGFCYTIPWAEGVRRMAVHWDANGAIDTAQDHPQYDPLICAMRSCFWR